MKVPSKPVSAEKVPAQVSINMDMLFLTPTLLFDIPG